MLEFAGDPREGSCVELFLEELMDANLLVVWLSLAQEVYALNILEDVLTLLSHIVEQALLSS